ncbi:SDR family NAD(P)-dependent oxidoreductase [Parahaliea maris]|uniref:SDR family NAD(P)-dependent oxidoreductase n=1 Tax=Parahaliea maris TaxID=2716870 RepID=A0A5C9A7R6_9GAMM|nr:SDR family NAD(P)-dependent oxidoreductase [Parahaliea maris]TXS96159.1 SDR family NAD(P)-dependent oxidoreductase [Parahaliea maris]
MTNGNFGVSILDEFAGSWAVVAGGSDGTGAAFARALAAAGMNLLLIARRAAPLDTLAAAIRENHAVEVRTASVDLSESDAGRRVIDLADGLEVSLFVSNAGSDPYGSAFLKAPISDWSSMVRRNIDALVEPSYAFAEQMVSRGRGAIIVMSSGAALGGQPGGAIYSGTKAFGLNFAESLYSELKPLGVHVLCAVCAAMNTPSLNQLLGKRGLSIPDLDEPDAVVSTLLDYLGRGPSYIFPFAGNDELVRKLQRQRQERLIQMEHVSKAFYNEI